MKIAIFTDSRGEFKGRWDKKQIFTEKITNLLKINGHEVTTMLCPFKWTSTIDFIQIIEEKIIDINTYDMIILYTGIVDFSPRPLSNFDMCYDSKGKEVNENITVTELLHSKKKIINNKKIFMKDFFGETSLNNHVNSTLGTMYMGEDTRSLISVEMNENSVIPYLRKHNKKIIYINSNYVCPDWEGDYILKNKNGRPKNIGTVKEYIDQYKEAFKYIIDLSEWSPEEIKTYTIDNMHLTFEGSEWIYNRLINMLSEMNVV